MSLAAHIFAIGALSIHRFFIQTIENAKMLILGWMVLLITAYSALMELGHFLIPSILHFLPVRPGHGGSFIKLLPIISQVTQSLLFPRIPIFRLPRLQTVVQ